MGSDFGYSRITLKDEERWNDLLLNSFHASYRSSMLYEYSKKHIGREPVTFIFHKNREDIGGVHYSVKRSYLGFIKTADILSGIVFKNEPDDELLGFILEHFVSWALTKRVSYIRYNPWIPISVESKKPDYATSFEICLRNYGFSPLNKGSHTYWIDLTQSEDQLLKNMKSSTRAKILKASKADIKTEIYTKPDQIIIGIFWGLYSGLGKKKGFRLLEEKRFKEEVWSLMDAGQAALFLISYKGITINVALASKFGHSMYFHGALNPDYKTLEGCPAPGHIAQWEIIKYMKSLDLEVYDMAFCPGEIPDKNHPNFDMWRFKYGFGGKHVQFMPVYGKILHRITGRLFQYLRYKK